MTFIVTSEFELNRVAAPALPLAPEAYNRSYQDQLNNVLRLYFNRIDSILGALQPVETINTISFTVYTVVTLPWVLVLGLLCLMPMPRHLLLLSPVAVPTKYLYILTEQIGELVKHGHRFY